MQHSRKRFTFIKEQFSGSLKDHSGMVPFPFFYCIVSLQLCSDCFEILAAEQERRWY